MIELRRINLNTPASERHDFLTREWIVTNGLGGYASGTVAGGVTRRYHGLLVSAMPSPLGRVMMLNHLGERLQLADGRTLYLGGGDNLAHNAVAEFRLAGHIPTWTFEVEDIIIEKRLLLLHRQNTVHLTYTLLSSQLGVRLELQPSVDFRNHDDPVCSLSPKDYGIFISQERYELSAGDGWPVLRLSLSGGDVSFHHEMQTRRNIRYELEAQRGYDSEGNLWTPGCFTAGLQNDRRVSLIASTEPWNIITTLGPEAAFNADEERRRSLLEKAAPALQQAPAAELVLAADQFLIRPAGRAEDSAWANAAGGEVGTVIAGYHWFTDWGRDTMISLEGLTLATGRPAEARWILRTFAHYLRDGLIPNMFPEGKNNGLYHTADATLWFFHALERYVRASGDRHTLRLIMPKLREIIDFHLAGTHFGIHVDPTDGLLVQGQLGYQLTWMDAKVDDWVVTPRRGKAVEINALWYNALRLLEIWSLHFGDLPQAELMNRHAQRARQSFNLRFWNPQTGHLFDVVDGESTDDPACRPNQLFAISLDHPVLDPQHWPAVVRIAEEKLLTPMGLRTLSPDHPDYKPRYDGDLHARDAAYHQGTVWPWLIGPFIDSWLRVHPERRAEARGFLDGFIHHLDEAAIGSISEIFDAEPPFRPRGCIAQAWSVAEVLRTWLKTAT